MTPATDSHLIAYTHPHPQSLQTTRTGTRPLYVPGGSIRLAATARVDGLGIMIFNEEISVHSPAISVEKKGGQFSRGGRGRECEGRIKVDLIPRF